MSSCFTAHPRPLAVDFDRDDASTHLGKGTFGQVFRARCTLTNAPVAVKVMSKSISRVPAPHLLVMFTSEVNALDALNGSPHVVSLVGYEETPSEMHIGTELALGGTVFDAFLASCRARAVIPTPVIKAVVWQTLTALRRVHAMGLVHRDVKPENLLLRDAMPTARLDEASPANIHVLLSDFGSATHAPVKDRDAAGTTMYLSPESVAFLREAAASTLHSASSSSGPSKSYGTPHDVWAVGVILLELLLRKRPFAAKPGQGDSKTLITKFAQNTTFRTALLDQIECPDARDLAQGLLCPDPSARLTCDEALAHPWIKSATPDLSTTSTTASSDVVVVSVDRSVKSNVRSAGALCHALCPRSPTTE